MKHTLKWTVGHSSSPQIFPEKMVTAHVPGNANLDWAHATNMPNWKRDTNFEAYKWMEDSWWLYEAKLPSLDCQNGDKLFFVTHGIDYEYHILLNGVTLHEHEGMFSPVELLLEPNKNENLLQIWIAPPPKDTLGTKDTREEAVQSCKPAVSYGWDFHPRLIPVGIWNETYIEVRSASYVKQAYVEYTLAEDFSEVELTFVADVIGDGEAAFKLYDQNGSCVVQARAGETKTLVAPHLWWCNGYGEPYLYQWDCELLVNGAKSDEKKGTVGFRTLTLEMNEGSWDVLSEFPMGRNPVPITLVLNGVPIFAKGSNWVNPDVFTGTITHETYLAHIKIAKESNFNILRCWGGAIVNKKAFYDLCDEYGILVWQEFQLACGNYRGTPKYLKILEQEARAIITRLKHHPSLAMWCGGNELFNNWSKMTDQSKALRLLNKLCYELDEQRPFLMTSPLYGMGHGYYTFRYPDGREVFEVMPLVKNTAYTEFGIPSISNLECCLSITAEKNLFPLEVTDTTIGHHAFYAWNDVEPWAYLGTIRNYFGEANSLEKLISFSQWLQAEGYKCIFEEARRQKPYCSMAINWCYNEPWPTLANNSLINYPSNPKSSLKDVADACRPALVSARIPKFSWRSGELFSADIWLLNDGLDVVEAGQAEICLELAGETYQLHLWEYGKVEANKNLEGPTVRLRLPDLLNANETAIAALNQGVQQSEKGSFHEMNLIIKAGEMSSKYRLVFNE